MSFLKKGFAGLAGLASGAASAASAVGTGVAKAVKNRTVDATPKNNAVAGVQAFRDAYSITPPNTVTPPKPLTPTPFTRVIQQTRLNDQSSIVDVGTVMNYKPEYCWRTQVIDTTGEDEPKSTYLGTYKRNNGRDYIFSNGTVLVNNINSVAYHSSNPNVVRVACRSENSNPPYSGGSRKKHRTLKHRRLRKNKHTLRKKARHMSRTRN